MTIQSVSQKALCHPGSGRWGVVSQSAEKWSFSRHSPVSPGEPWQQPHGQQQEEDDAACFEPMQSRRRDEAK